MSSVAIFLHQQHYTAGDALSGDVVVTVSHPLQAHHVTLFIDGREKVFWEGTQNPSPPDYLPSHFFLLFLLFLFICFIPSSSS
jgi:hypothetical protein